MLVEHVFFFFFLISDCIDMFFNYVSLISDMFF